MKPSIALVVALMALAHEVSAQCDQFTSVGPNIIERPSEIPPEVLSFYRQKSLNLEDPIGDMALVKVSSSNFNDALRSLLKLKPKPLDKNKLNEAKECASDLFKLGPDVLPELGLSDLYSQSEDFENDRKLLLEVLNEFSDVDKKKVLNLFDNGEIILEGRKDSFDGKELGQKLVEVILEEEKKGLTPYFGEIHRWSKEFKAQRAGFKEHLKSLPSKILTVLSGGKSAALLKAGPEEDLRDFILKQDDLSLVPIEIFRKSYQLNQGNIYLSLLTIENVLSEHWLHPKRHQLKQTNKLKPIGKTFGSHGDVFGHWYHLFGMIYYAYAEGAFMAKLSGKTEALGSLVLSGFKGEAQENRMNMLGAEVGVVLRKFMLAREKGEIFEIKVQKKFKPENLRKRLAKKIKNILRKK
jgi:hypothetical protein